MGNDRVDHPKHYGGKDDAYETIKILEHKLTFDEFVGFCKGNAYKYLDRAGRKNPLARAEDLMKASWYLLRLIDYLNGPMEAA